MSLLRESLTLHPEEWEKLQRMAEEFGTFAPTGITAGQPTWRSLIKEIARGNFVLSRTPSETPETEAGSDE